MLQTISNDPDDLLSPFPHVIRSGVEVSFIYNYYRKEKTILRSVDSILKQSLSMCGRKEIEIVLVDDGSDEQHVQKVRQDLPPEVIYLWQRDCGYGICRAKNTGAKIANGRYLVFLDPDIVLSEDFVDSLLRGFHHYGQRVLLSSYIQGYYFAGSADPRDEFGVWENPNRVTSRFSQLASTCFAIPRSLFMESGGFDEDIIHGGVEDLVFGYQVGTLAETGIVFNTEMQVEHIPHPVGTAHADPQKSWEVVKLKCPEFYDQYIIRGLR